MLNILCKSMKRQTKRRKLWISINIIKKQSKQYFQIQICILKLELHWAALTGEDKINTGWTQTEAKLFSHGRIHNAGLHTEFDLLAKLGRHVYFKWILVMGCKCWAMSPIKMKNLTYKIKIELVKHQGG